MDFSPGVDTQQAKPSGEFIREEASESVSFSLIEEHTFIPVLPTSTCRW